MSKGIRLKLRRSRGGRPKSHRPKVDMGTPELQAPREAVGLKDAALSTAPLDVLKGRGAICDEAYSAACYFTALRKLVFGKVHIKATNVADGRKAGPPKELDTDAAERKYRDACNYVRGQSRLAFDALENLVVHEQWPAWMFAGRGKRDTAQRHFEVGAAALLAWYRGARVRG